MPTKGQALIHLLLAASLHHDLVRGPMRGTEQAFVSAAAWLGPAPRPLGRDDALALLVRRYLAGHAPAGPEDLAVWSGLPLTDARRAFDQTGLTRSRRKPRALPAPTLLGPFDPLLHGWASRAPFVGEHQRIVTTNGIFRPIALVEGKAVATWSLAAGTITIAPLEPLNAATHRSLTDDATDVLRFLGLAPRPYALHDINAERQSHRKNADTSTDAERQLGAPDHRATRLSDAASCSMRVTLAVP